MNNLEEIRSEYQSDRLDLDNLDTDPIVQFRYWLNDAIRARIPEPTAMVLSTATAKGRPSSRVVLLKDLNREGFVFFTNYESRKGKQISENPYGSLLFYWPLLERQVRIEGTMTKTTRKQSDAYFLTRPEGSKIGAWSSPQSTRIPSRQYLDNLQQDYTLLFRNKAVERPENWGGYILIPEMFEFWQGRENRLHDRFEYTLNGNLWEINRLAP